MTPWGCSCTRPPDGGTPIRVMTRRTTSPQKQRPDGARQNPSIFFRTRRRYGRYYPYNQAVADGTKVPVPINAGTSVDYMWGKSTNQVSVIETDAVIPMKHALSQLVIRLKVSPEYHNDGNLTSAKLKSKAAKFGTSGTMNLNDNGRIIFSPTSTELSWTPKHDHSGTGEPVGRLRRRNLSHEPGIRRSQHGGRHRRGNLYLFHSPDKLGSRKEIYLFDNDALQ